MTTKRPPLPINPDYQVEVSCCWDNRFLPNLFLKQNNLRQELIMLPHQTCRQPPTSKVYKFLHFNFLRLNMYSTARRDVLGCTSPTTKRFPEAREMSRGRSPRDISRAEGNLEVGGDVQPNTSRFEAVYGHSLIINPSLGMYQEIPPSLLYDEYK